MAVFQVKNKDILIAVGTLLIVLAVWLAYKAVWMPMRIKQVIATANYCEVTEDCQLARGRCDLDGVGFWIPVNKSRAYGVEMLVSRAISLKTPMLCAMQTLDTINNDRV